MVRTSKSSDKQSAPAPAQTAAPAPAEKKAVAKKSAPAPAAAAAPAPVENKVVAPAPVVQEAAPETADSLSAKLNLFEAKLQQLAGLFSVVKTEYKVLSKTVARELKNAQKSSSRKKKVNGNRQPSGFVKPIRISDEMAQFLGKPVGSEIARTEVSKEIHKYIVDNGLKNKTNGRHIDADSKLSTLLKLGKNDTLTYFNLQKYMKHHFIKQEAPSTA
jgi:chromatin remodeling complex protein RSC6